MAKNTITKQAQKFLINIPNWDYFIVIISSFIIFFATLHPFNFHLSDSWSIRDLLTDFNNSSFFQDQVNNVLLFMPFGFGLGSILQRRKIKLIGQLFTTTVLSATLSLTVELLQTLIPSRAPTPSDIFHNSFGGFLGLLCFYIYGSRSFNLTLNKLENSHSSKSIKKIAIFSLAYVLFAFLISIPWQSMTSLNSWDSDFHLILGNEGTGDRPWKGDVSQLYISDRAISQNEVKKLLTDENNFQWEAGSLIADYQLNQIQNYYQDRTGNLPELVWEGEEPPEKQSVLKQEEPPLNSRHWLKTKIPATTLSQRIGKTSEFTISANITTADVKVTGPGRIISMSADGQHRNFTLGQQEDNLEFRFRTPLTGSNGSDLNMNIPGVFTSENSHHIVITYSKATLEIYIDEIQNYHSLHLLEIIPKKQILFYYGITFIPLGVCLALLTTLAKRRLNFYRILLWMGILLPSLILEASLISGSGKNPSLKNLLIGTLFTAGTMSILRIRAKLMGKKLTANN
ncbi:MAG: VanZ family protein [Mastigocoleus sp. MO_167.B18]|uniref:VanZ family protein n=1 Tax=Mastigocoleus sp. MO_188.B34 TaxID=3036635 RepID=UPI0026080EA1|nr:VanZ family protein [Mastigocoleus sp. MO_188.B34]MDJ0697495.1 VanZ family protein [Mastigocoleus sp. MO_188.B34]MDJ0774132.1 VanZ family protein [Mastigocoleus sp. MO_167.B18]